LVPTFFYSCCRSSLTVQTDYLTQKDLASYYVGTPDPRQNFATVGQRLIICWSLPKFYLSYQDLHLEVTIRFRNRQEIIEIFDILQARGTYVFELLNSDYALKKGILTYKVDLVGGGVVLEEWRHKIWSDLIVHNIGGAGLQESQDVVMDDVKNMQREYEDEYPIDWHDDQI